MIFFQLYGGVCDGAQVIGMNNLEAIAMPLLNTKGYDAIYKRSTHGLSVDRMEFIAYGHLVIDSCGELGIHNVAGG
jgi:hypothetical protein